MNDATNGNPNAAVAEPPPLTARGVGPLGEAAPPADGPGRAFASVRYYVVLGVLGVCALGMQSAARYLEAYFQKEPLALRKPLHLLSVAKLGPEYGLHPRQPEPLSGDLVENLGTEQYLDWRLIDRGRSPDDPAYLARLFITYYTGQPDMVPHEPRECQQAAGLELVDEEQYVVPVGMPDGREVSIPVAALQFAVPGGAGGPGSRLTVLFFFYANGDFVTTRAGVRLRTSNLWDRYAYYSKIEVAFTNERGDRLAGREESKEAGARLLRKLMPILWADHYPDWDAISRGESAP